MPKGVIVEVRGDEEMTQLDVDKYVKSVVTGKKRVVRPPSSKEKNP